MAMRRAISFLLLWCALGVGVAYAQAQPAPPLERERIGFPNIAGQYTATILMSSLTGALLGHYTVGSFQAILAGATAGSVVGSLWFINWRSHTD